VIGRLNRPRRLRARGPTDRQCDVFVPSRPGEPHCLGFGQPVAPCNGVVRRACANGAVSLHTGIDIRAAAGQPVMAAGNGVTIDHLIDPSNDLNHFLVGRIALALNDPDDMGP